MDPRFELLIFDEKKQMTVYFIRKLLLSMTIKESLDKKNLDEYSYMFDNESVSIGDYLLDSFGFDFHFGTYYPHITILEKELCSGNVLSDIRYNTSISFEYNAKTGKPYNFNDPNCLRPCFEMIYYILTHFSGEVSIMFIHHDNYMIGYKGDNRINFFGNDKLYFNDTLMNTFTELMNSKGFKFFVIDEAL